MMLCDTNILIYSLDSKSPFQLKASRFIEDNFPKNLFFTPQIFLECYNIVTQRKGFTLSPKEAIEIVELFSEEANLVLPKTTTYRKALELCKKNNKTGPIIFDAYLVATALDNNIQTIATANTSDFVIFTEINTFNPFAPNDIIESEEEFRESKGKRLRSLKDLRQ